MSNIRSARETLIARILQGDGRSSHADRRAAFGNGDLGEPLSTLVRKVAHDASAVSDQDVAAVLNAGVEEDQVFELLVCAAVGEASRLYDAARAALDAATSES